MPNNNTHNNTHKNANIKTDNANQSSVNHNRYPCPQCQTLTAWQDNPYKPFCSRRCKLIDLGTWADEGYVIAGQTPTLSLEEHWDNL